MKTTRSPDRVMPGGLWDAVIVGGGPAGLSAGLVLARARFAALVIDGGEPRNRFAEHMHGYLSRDGMASGDFLTAGRAEFIRYGGALVPGSVIAARRGADGAFELELDDAQIVRARTVLVSTGVTDELPAIEGLAEHWGSRVHHCPHCHGYEVRDKAVVVLGGAVAAASIHLAALMRRHTADVTFCVNGAGVGVADRRRLEAWGVRLIDGKVGRIQSGTGDPTGLPLVIGLEDGTTVACESIFVPPRAMPHDAILTALGADMDAVSGLVAVDPRGTTTVPGLWAAGNLVDPRAQVINAAAAGASAAIAMTGWLLECDVDAAVASRCVLPDGEH